jgi:hypothetical protein
LFNSIRRPVMVNADQTPQYSDVRRAGHDGGDFLFVRSRAPSEATKIISPQILAANSRNSAPISEKDAVSRGQAALRIKDFEEAAKWYRRAADQGEAGAQGMLGAFYLKGLGVPKDELAAAKWTRRSADQGNAKAQSLLGSLYTKGVGVPKDNTEAVRWFRLAAEQGHANAQALLGTKYFNGIGVQQDNTEAVTWFRRAAERGHAGAQGMLGTLYTEGKIVAQDFVKAAKWFNLATARGFTMVGTNKSNLLRRMTRAQISEAQRLARLWKPTK